MKIKDLIKEEVQKMLEASMTKGFRKAVEALQDIQLKQQKLRKAFVAEKNPKKKDKLKQALINMHKIVQKAELDFNRAISNEPVDLEEIDVRKTHGDRRIENPKTGNDVKLRTALKAKKGTQVYQKARKIYNRLKDKE
jgi:predicted RNA-binding protein with EMAP domain